MNDATLKQIAAVKAIVSEGSQWPLAARARRPTEERMQEFPLSGGYLI